MEPKKGITRLTDIKKKETGNPLLFSPPKGNRKPDPVVLKNGRRNSKIIAFGWYRGKYSHLSWLLPLPPHTHHYLVAGDFRDPQFIRIFSWIKNAT